jgi:hypothetical protein
VYPGECEDPDGDGVGTMNIRRVCGTEVSNTPQPCNTYDPDEPLPVFGFVAAMLTLAMLVGFYLVRNRKL